MYFYLYNGFTSNHTNITEWPWSNTFNERDIVVYNDHYILSPPYLLHETLGNWTPTVFNLPRFVNLALMLDVTMEWTIHLSSRNPRSNLFRVAVIFLSPKMQNLAVAAQQLIRYLQFKSKTVRSHPPMSIRILTLKTVLIRFKAKSQANWMKLFFAEYILAVFLCVWVCGWNHWV